MIALLRVLLGATALAGGGALVSSSGAAAVQSALHTHDGLGLGTLFAVAAGLGLVGAGFDLLRGRRRPEVKESIANSVWATRKHIEDAKIAADPRAPGGGLYLGRFVTDDGGLPVELRYRGTKHILCAGVPGSNKTTGLVVPLLSEGQPGAASSNTGAARSIICLDLKLQNAPVTMRKRALLGSVIVLNPFGVLADELPGLQSAGWNPLLQLDPESDDFESDAYCIAEAMIDSAGAADSSSGKFFQESALNLAAALVMWERFLHGDKASLCRVRATVCAPNEFKEVDGPPSPDKSGSGAASEKKLCGGFLYQLELMRHCKHAAIKNVSARLYSRLTDANSKATAAQDVIDTFMASTRFLDDPRIRRDMAKGGRIDFAALHREITTIYIGLPPHQLAAQAKWLRLFINMALAELYKHPPRVPVLPPVLLLLDEFGNVGRLSNIVSAMNVSRDYSVQLAMFLQNHGQLRASYPNEYQSFYSGCGVLTTFCAGDAETQEVLSKLFGNVEMIVPTETVNGVSMTPHAIPLIRPEDISRLGPGETISRIEPCPWPVRGVAPVYPKTRFNEGLDPNPYYRG